MSQSEVCYQPPVDYVDQFYMFVYDAFQNNLVEGNSYLNQTVYIPGGFDFVLRRIVGLDSVLAPTTGKFQWRSSNQVNTSTAPIIAAAAMRDQLIVPEVFFPQTSQIAFDLYNVQKRFAFAQGGTSAASVRLFMSQIGFAGVRRRRIGIMPTPGNYKRIPFQTVLTLQTYTQPNVITAPNGTNFGPQSIGNAISGNLTFSNFDTEIHMIQCVDTNPSAGAGPGNIPTGLNWFAIIPYDSARNALTSAYVMSQYISDSIPFGQESVGAITQTQDPTLVSTPLYGMGAVVPPLLYPKETQFRVDAVSMVGNHSTTYDWTAGGALSIVLTGYQRIPC